MSRVLYIGDPLSVHDVKWMSFFSTRKDFKVYLIAQEAEMQKLTDNQRDKLAALNIEIAGSIKSYSLWRFWENNKSISTIRAVVKNQNIDVVHPLFATPFAIWTSYLNVPSVITTRGSDVLVVLSGLLNSSGLRRLHSKLLLKNFKTAFNQAEAITCTSQGQLNRLNQIFNSSFAAEIIRTGVEAEQIANLKFEFDFPTEFNGKKVVFLPRYIRPIYQTELQLDALSKLPKNVKDELAVFLISGKRANEQYTEYIETMASEMGITYHIQESLTQPEMWSVFKQSFLTIMTPKTDGTPNSALEAMAAKCPVILGNFSYDEDLFSQEFCLRMKSNSSSELTELINSALLSYPKEKLEKAFENVLVKGNRPTEMSRLHKLYLSLFKR